MGVNRLGRIAWRLRRCATLSACCVFLTCYSTTSHAVVSTITNLANGATISFSALVGSNPLSLQIGDKIYGDFSYSLSGGTAPLPSDLVLKAVENQFGYGFSLQMPLIATGSQFKDVVLDFSVTAPGALISGIDLSFASSVSGHGIATIAENVFTNGFGSGLIAALQVANPGAPTVFEDSAFFTIPQHEIWIEKDILVDGNGFCSSTDWAHISIVDQTVSQIPEPNTMALSVFGLIFCLFAKRRR